MADNALFEPAAGVPGTAPTNALLAAPPSMADAYEYHAQALQRWMAEQRASGVAAGTIDPDSGWPTQKGVVDAIGQAAQSVMMGTVAPGKMKIRAYHGSTEDFDVFDPARSGSGAMADYFAKGADFTKKPAAYLASTPEHAATYGPNVMPFDITGKVKSYNAVPDLKSWAKELGYGRDAQKMIDEYFDGDVYRALNADQYFLDKQEKAKASGVNAVSVDFGDFLHGSGRDRARAGKVYIVSDPAMLTRVRE